jgi:hypothetical protein
VTHRVTQRTKRRARWVATLLNLLERRYCYPIAANASSRVL